MNHLLLLPSDAMSELPAFPDDRRARTDEPAVLSYRSEAFAEDLSPTQEAPCRGLPAAPARARATLLVAVPLAVALAGALVVFGLA